MHMGTARFRIENACRKASAALASPLAAPRFPARENVLDRSPGEEEEELEEHRRWWLLVKGQSKRISCVKEERRRPDCKSELL